jgi:hypothetical protein
MTHSFAPGPRHEFSGALGAEGSPQPFVRRVEELISALDGGNFDKIAQEARI